MVLIHVQKQLWTHVSPTPQKITFTPFTRFVIKKWIHKRLDNVTGERTNIQLHFWIKVAQIQNSQIMDAFINIVIQELDATKVSCLLSSCYFQKLKKKHLQLSGEVRCTSFQTFKPPKKETKYNLRVNISLYNTQHQPLSLVKELDSNLKSLLKAVWVNLHYNAWKTTV